MTTSKAISYAAMSQRADVLLQELAGYVSHDTSTSGVRDVSAYRRTVDSVAALAGDAGLAGLHDVARLYAEGLSDIFRNNATPQAATWDAMRAWPELVSTYLQAPNSESAIEHLVQHLRSRELGTPLSSENAEILRSMLVLPQNQFSEQPLDTQGVRHVQAQMSLTTTQQTELTVDLADEGVDMPLTQAVMQLETAVREQDATANVTAARCASAVDTLAACAADAGLIGLHDVCRLLHESLGVFAEWNTPLSDAQHDVLKRWPPLISAYLDEPHSHKRAKAMLTNLNSSAFNYAMTTHNTEILSALLREDNLSGPIPGWRPTPAPSADHQQVAVDDAALSEFAALYAQQPADPEPDRHASVNPHPLLGAVTALIVHSERAPGNMARYLADYVAAVDVVARLAADSDRTGLHDLCMLTAEAIRRHTSPAAISPAQLDVLRTWPFSIQSFVVEPSRARVPTVLDPLLRCRLLDLSSSDETILRAMLEPAAEEQLTISNSPAFVDDFGALYSHDAHEPDDAVDAGTLDALDGAVSELSTQAQVSTPDEELYLAQYIAALSVVARLSVDAGRTGLHDVCMMLNESLIERRRSGEPLHAAQVSTLRAWPAAVADYVNAANAQRADSMLGALRESQLVSLDEGALAILRGMLVLEKPPIDITPHGNVPSAVDDFAALWSADSRSDSGAPSEPDEATTTQRVVDAVKALAGISENTLPENGVWLAGYVGAAETLAHCAADAGHAGLHDVALMLSQALTVSNQSDGVAPTRDDARLSGWHLRVIDYLREPNDTHAAAIVDDVAHYLRCAASERQVLLELLTVSGPEPGRYDVLTPLEARLEQTNVVALDAAVPTQEDSPEAQSAAPDGVIAQPVVTRARLSRQAQELVDLLGGELNRIRSEIFVDESHEGGNDEQLSVEGAREELSRFASASAGAGLQGLGDVCSHIADNMQALSASSRLEVTQASPCVVEALNGIADYLLKPADPLSVDAITANLGRAEWPLPLVSEDKVVSLRDALLSPQLDALDEETVERLETASADAVSLELPEDVDDELIDGLLQELPTQTAEFSSAIQRLSGPDGTLDDVEVAQRVAHTLKGAGNTVGVRGIATLTHNLEDILLNLSKNATLPAPALAEVMIRAADCLESMCEAMLGVSSAPQDAVSVLQEVLDWANHLDRDEDEAQPPTVEATTRRITRAPIEPQLQTNANAEPPEAVTPVATRTSDSPGPMLRVPATLVDNLLRLVGESIILTGQVREGLEQAEVQTRTMGEQYELLRNLGHELEELVDIKNLQMAPRTPTSEPAFDPLEMEQYGELHTMSRRLVEAATDARELGSIMTKQLRRLDDFISSHEYLNRETQEAVLRTRMVPFKSVESRFERSVRQTCRLTHKEAALTISGGDTLMDSDVLNEMVDPLMHILRNAVDHGIEDSAARQAAGKPTVGSITVDVGREGSTIVISCSDDGAGMDLAAIENTAATRGLLDSPSALSSDDLVKLTLRPNFSTRTSITQISGRGIGLDAVAAKISNLGGTLGIRSVAGQGCTIELKLPVTLISTHALLVRARDQVFAVAERGVEQILHCESGEFVTENDEIHFSVGEQRYPVRAFNVLLEVGTGKLEAARSILLVDSDGQTFAIAVDEVVDSRDVVVKGLGHYIPKMPGIVGATILGDGSVTPMLDLPELARRPTGMSATANVPEAIEDLPELPSALVVDDSLSARRAIVQLMGDAGYRVLEARDGMEAASILETQVPNVILTDLEMPRMNGMELARHIRGRAELTHVPIIMVTSRTTAKHQNQAQTAGVDVYVTKPFSEDQLLDHVVACVETSERNAASMSASARRAVKH